MRTVTFKTKNAVFEFDLSDVQERLNHYTSKHKVDETVKLLEFLLTQPSRSIDIPKDSQYFGYIALDLINAGKGSVKCKRCNQTYQPSQLKPITIGHGETPFSVNLKKKGAKRCVPRKLPSI